MNKPEPFDSAELGALYTALEFMKHKQRHALNHAAHLEAQKILDKVEAHFIAAGGDPKDLEG